VTTPAQELASVRLAREAVQVRERAAVQAARLEGMSWAEVSRLLGLSVSTVHDRHRS
jgi:DNA-directed RNA polymerase specialized sigma24 family protein